MMSNEAPRVRPLVWDRDGGEWWADTGLGRDLHYWIYPAAAHSQWILAFCSTILSIHDSWEEAQAAGQADFEHRIQSALSAIQGRKG